MRINIGIYSTRKIQITFLRIGIILIRNFLREYQKIIAWNILRLKNYKLSYLKLDVESEIQFFQYPSFTSPT